MVEKFGFLSREFRAIFRETDGRHSSFVDGQALGFPVYFDLCAVAGRCQDFRVFRGTEGLFRWNSSSWSEPRAPASLITSDWRSICNFFLFEWRVCVFALSLSRFLSRRRAAALRLLFRRTASLALGWFLAKFRLTLVRGPVVVRS